jgi:hypothetical protein
VFHRAVNVGHRVGNLYNALHRLAEVILCHRIVLGRFDPKPFSFSPILARALTAQA